VETELFQAPAPQETMSTASVRPPRAWWRLAGTPSGLTLVFDGAVFAAMGVLGWKLVMPWGDALSAGESLMVIGLIVCAGLWASICAEDLYRWRKLCRRWSAQAGRSRAAELQRVPAPAPAVPIDPLPPARPRVRSAVLPSHRASRALSHTPWHVVTRH
jgi:hypothetical protein